MEKGPDYTCISAQPVYSEKLALQFKVSELAAKM